MPISDLVIENLYNFSTNLQAGWQATIYISDEDNNPIDLTGHTASMALRRADDNLLEFNWTTQNNRLTFGDSRIIANVSQGQMTPNRWLLEVEKYPKQIYRYTLEVNKPDQTLLLAFTGNFTIYNF